MDLTRNSIFPRCMLRPTDIALTEGAYNTTMVRLRLLVKTRDVGTQPWRASVIVGWLHADRSGTSELTVSHAMRNHFAPFDGMVITSNRVQLDELKATLLAHATIMVQT